LRKAKRNNMPVAQPDSTPYLILAQQATKEVFDILKNKYGLTNSTCCVQFLDNKFKAEYQEHFKRIEESIKELFLNQCYADF
jgi:hypothetical protein